MSKLVEIPDWVKKVPILGRYMRPLMTGGGVSTSDQDLILKIVSQFRDQSRKDIKQWRECEEAFDHPENPRTYLMQDLYDYLLPNAQLGTATDIRVAATLGKKFIVYDRKTNIEIPEKTKLLETEWFFNFVWNFLDTVFRGYTVAQLLNPETMEFSYLPRRNIIPQKNMFVFEVEGDKGINYKEPPFDKSVISVFYKNKKGIYNDIVPNLIWMKNARESWNEFAEKFGIAPITAETNKTNQKDLDRLEFLLKSLGEAATAIFPLGTKITIHDQATKGDPYNVFLKQIELDKADITKRLLGGTMLTDDGSSKSQSEVHERVHESLSMFDRMMITFLVNGSLFKMMPSVFGENDGFKFDDSEKISLKDHWEITKGMLETGYEIEDIEWAAKKFNVPVTAFNRIVKTAPANFNKANSTLAASLLAKGVTLPVYKASSCGHNHKPMHVAADDFTGNLLSELSDELINLVWDGKDTLITEVLKAITTHRSLLDGLMNSWSDRLLDITYDATDHHCLAAMEYNLFDFSRMKEKANVFALNELKGTAKDFNEFRDQALPYLKNADVNHLKTEYNHTFAVGQGASRYHQFMSEADDIPYGIIQTVGDDRVRPKHQVLNGKLVSLKDGGPSIWTPFDIGCRCEILQYLDKIDKAQVLSSEKMYELIGKQTGDKWTGNRGKDEEVFKANEMYIKSHGLAEDLNKLTYHNYKLPAYDTVKENYPSIALDKTITKKNVQELFTAEKGKQYMGFDDYMGRKMILKKKVFDDQVTKQNRHQLFAKVQDALSEPDEVYYSSYGKGKFETKYVKYYNDSVMVVPATLGKTNIEINSWYEMDNEAATRKGYLIHKKSGK
jgi:hypothetical protein